MKVNPNWWDKNTGNVTEVIYTPIKSDPTRVAALIAGDKFDRAKAQQMLEQAAPQLANADMQRLAWRTLAQLAEQKEDAARAQLCWKRAAEVAA